MQTSNKAMNVVHPIMPTGTPFSVPLRLFIRIERVTDHTHKRIAHVIMSNDEMIIITATNSSNDYNLFS